MDFDAARSWRTRRRDVVVAVAHDDAVFVQLTRRRHDRLSTHGARATHHQHRTNNLRRARTSGAARITPASGLRGMELTHL